MTNKKVTRRALLMSVTSLLICISMLLGTTFAWFTDEVTSGVNKIVAGNLDVELEHVNTPGGTAESVSGDTKLFNVSADQNKILWEPGAMAYEVFTVKNVGTLALKYNMRLNAIGNNFVVEAGQTTATQRSLLDVLRVAVVDSALASPTREGIAAANYTWTTLKDFAIAVQDIELLPAAQKQFTVILYWPSDTETISALAGTGYTDNDYNLKNGAKASDAGTDQVGQLYVDLGVTLVATQLQHEADSFDNTYDADATMPADGWSGVNTANMINTSVTNAVDTSANGTTDGNTTTYAAQETTVTDTATGVSATVPASALASYAKTVVTDSDTTTTTETELELTVAPTTASNAVVTAATSGDTALFYDIDMTAITTATTTDNTNNSTVGNPTVTSAPVTSTDALIEVTLPIGKGLELQGIYHKTTQLTTSANGDGEYYTYDVDTGILTLYVKTFSPFSIAYKYAGGLGTKEYPYLIANYNNYVSLLTSTSTTHSSGATIYHIGVQNVETCPAKTYISIIDDIDFNWQNPFEDDYTTRLYEYNLVIDGNGHTLSNVYGAIFSAFNENKTYRFWDNEIKNLTIDNFVAGGSYGTAMGYCGAFGNTGTCTFERITVNYDTSIEENYSKYGSMLGWTGNAPIVFKDCMVTGADVRGGSDMCIGGYVGNGQNITFDNCKFQGTVTSDSENAGGFVGQGGANVVIRNCEVSEGTIIKNKKSGGTVQAFGTANKELTNNAFYGMLICDSKSKATQSENWASANTIPAGTFSINDDGKITYNGTESIKKVEVRTTYAIDRLNTTVSPARFDGYMPATVKTIIYEDVISGSQFAQIDKITNIINVVDEEYVDNVFNGTTDASALTEENKLENDSFYLDGTTVYVDGRGNSPAFYSGSARYTNNELTATNLTTAKAVILVYAYDEAGENLGVNTLTYTFTVNN